MKIYCSTDKNNFDRYVGKDYWVEVHNKINDYTYYIQILHKDPGNVLWVHKIGYLAIDDPEFEHSRSVDWYDIIYNKVHREYGDQLEIVQPIQLLTTQEIADIVFSKVHS